MLILRNTQAIKDLSDPELRQLLQARIQEIEPDDLQDVGYAVVVQSESDCLEQLNELLGFDVQVNRWTGLHWRDKAFKPHWEVIESHGAWWSLTFVESDGRGVLLYVPKHQTGLQELSEMCTGYAIPSSTQSSEIIVRDN